MAQGSARNLLSESKAASQPAHSRSANESPLSTDLARIAGALVLAFFAVACFGSSEPSGAASSPVLLSLRPRRRRAARARGDDMRVRS